MASSQMRSSRPLAELVGAGWATALSPIAGDVAAMLEFLRAEHEAGRPWLPNGERVLSAFNLPFDKVRVLIVGQDPYPTPGHSIGLAFAVDRSVRPVPRSLANIYRELQDDLGFTPPNHGDLSGWADQGVMLLNRVLTVQSGLTGSHRGKGWEAVTDQAVRALADRGGPLVAILWGRDAASLAPLLGTTPTITSAHPSPLSAHRGFFGSKPFSRANELLRSLDSAPIDWRVDS